MFEESASRRAWHRLSLIRETAILLSSADLTDRSALNCVLYAEACDKCAGDQKGSVEWRRVVIFAQGLRLAPAISSTGRAVVASDQLAQGLVITRQNT